MVSNKIKFLYMNASWKSTKFQLEHMFIEIQQNLSEHRVHKK